MRKISKSFFSAQDMPIVINIFKFNVRFEAFLFFKIGRWPVKAISSAELVIIPETKIIHERVNEIDISNELFRYKIQVNFPQRYQLKKLYYVILYN